MALVVEDGTGIATADSYLSLTDASTYFTNHANPTAWVGATTAVQEASLRYAARWLDMKFTWIGYIGIFTQNLGWPRIYARFDHDEGHTLDAVPGRLKEAQCEAALSHIKVSPLNLVKAPNSQIEDVAAGSVRVRFNQNIPDADFNYIVGLLKGLYDYVALGGTRTILMART